MASAVSSPRAIHPPRPTEAGLSLGGHLVGVLLLSLPFFVLSLLLWRADFLSDSYARLLANVLVNSANARLDNVILSYPPFANIMALVWPNALWLMLLSSVAMGGILWMLWRQLQETQLHVVVRLLLILSFVLTPLTSFASTQALTQVLTLTLLLAAWISYNRFTRERITWNGFLTGLILGLGFYVSLYAAVFSLFFAVSTPLYFREAQDESGRLHWPAVFTGMIVVLFPVAVSFLIWSYLNWLFSGDFLSFLTPVRNTAYVDYVATVGRSIPSVVAHSVSQLVYVPVYLVVGLLEVLYSPRRLLAYLAPLAVVLVSRSAGLLYPDSLALLTYSMTAVAAVPRRASAHWGVLLLGVALLKVLVNLTTPIDPGWLNALQRQTSTRDQIEIALGERLRTVSDDRVMVDNVTAYRLIARTATGAPFLTPDEPAFELATAAPGQFVDYILLTPDDRVGQLFDLTPPGFVHELTWQEWQLYRRADVPPLVAR